MGDPSSACPLTLPCFPFPILPCFKMAPLNLARIWWILVTTFYAFWIKKITFGWWYFYRQNNIGDCIQLIEYPLNGDNIVNTVITGDWDSVTEWFDSKHWSSFDVSCFVCLAGRCRVFWSVFWQRFPDDEAKRQRHVLFVDKDREFISVWE